MLGPAEEALIWHPIVVCAVVARLTSRYLLFGSFKKLQIDDWLMLFALFSYTSFIICMRIIVNVGTNLLEPGTDVSTMAPSEISEREYGSKVILVLEEGQLATIWTAKACLLILYFRVTRAAHKWENLAVKIVAVYTILGFIIMEALYLGYWCRPFHEYWAVPTSNSQCSTALNHLIVSAVFNISSELALLIIGVQMVARSRLPPKRKLLLGCVFGVASFSVLSSILNKAYSFMNPYGSNWTYWYIRESSTQLIVANLPFMWTLLRRVFYLKAFNASTENSSAADTSVSFNKMVRTSRKDDQVSKSTWSQRTKNSAISAARRLRLDSSVSFSHVPEFPRPTPVARQTQYSLELQEMDSSRQHPPIEASSSPKTHSIDYMV